MGFYNTYILPRLLTKAMSAKGIEALRPRTIEGASGVVLEIGVGLGLNFPFYANLEKLYALEPSAELIAKARGRALSLPFPVEFLELGAEKLPLPDASVDTVVSTWTMCSVAHPDAVLKEIARVLKPNGVFQFIDHGLSPRPAVAVLQKLLTPFTKYFTGNCHLDRDITRLIENAGLRVLAPENIEERWKPLFYYTRGVAVKN